MKFFGEFFTKIRQIIFFSKLLNRRNGLKYSKTSIFQSCKGTYTRTRMQNFTEHALVRTLSIILTRSVLKFLNYIAQWMIIKFEISFNKFPIT